MARSTLSHSNDSVCSPRSRAICSARSFGVAGSSHSRANSGDSVTGRRSVRQLTKAAVDAVERVFRPGFKYSKAEVMLVNLCQAGEFTEDLFATTQSAEATNLMTVLDKITERWGRGTLRSAGVPINPDRAMPREMMSQSYTTKIDQLWTVACI